MSNIPFSREEINILERGQNYAFEKPAKHSLQDLIIDTENAIKQLDINEQNTYRFLAGKKIKEIQHSSKQNIPHKRQLYTIRQIRTKLKQNNLIITKAEKREHHSNNGQRQLH